MWLGAHRACQLCLGRWQCCRTACVEAGSAVCCFAVDVAAQVGDGSLAWHSRAGGLLSVATLQLHPCQVLLMLLLGMIQRATGEKDRGCTFFDENKLPSCAVSPDIKHAL